MLVLLTFAAVISSWLDPSTYWPVRFWHSLPPLEPIPAKYNVPSFPGGLFTRSWWYWHRQELVNDETRPDFWPLPHDLLWAVLVAVAFTFVRMVFNAGNHTVRNTHDATQQCAAV